MPLRVQCKRPLFSAHYGSLSLMPILSLSLLRPLAALSLSTVVLFLRAMPQSVSPLTTVCVPPLLLGAALAVVEDLALLVLAVLFFVVEDETLGLGGVGLGVVEATLLVVLAELEGMGGGV